MTLLDKQTEIENDISQSEFGIERKHLEDIFQYMNENVNEITLEPYTQADKEAEAERLMNKFSTQFCYTAKDIKKIKEDLITYQNY